MDIKKYLTKHWDLKKTTKQNVISFNNEQEQARRKGERLRKKLFPLFVILGVALSILTQNPLFALALFIGAISWGSEYVFNAGTSDFISVSILDSTHFVVAYRDESNSHYGTAIIGTVSNGDDIAFGSEYVFNTAGNSYYISVSTLDSTHFVVAYKDGGNSNYGTAIIGTVSFSSISTYKGLASASIVTKKGLAIASIATAKGLA